MEADCYENIEKIWKTKIALEKSTTRCNSGPEKFVPYINGLRPKTIEVKRNEILQLK